MLDFAFDCLHSHGKKKLDLSFTALHPLMSSFFVLHDSRKGESSWKDNANFYALATTQHLKCLCKTVQVYVKGSGK